MPTPRSRAAAGLVLALALAGCSAPASQTAPASAGTGSTGTGGPATAGATAGSAPAASGSSTASAAAGTPSASAAPDAQPSTGRTPGASGTVPAGTNVTVALTGDLLWHISLLKSVKADAKAAGSAQLYEFDPLFANVAPIIADADVAVCHQEVPIVAKGQRVTGYPAFGAPVQTAAAVKKLGFDLCTTASNHSLDRGIEGVKTTLTALRDAGIVASGTSATQAESTQPRIFTTASGVKVAVVAGAYALNGEHDVPAWQWDYLDAQTMIDRGKQARAAGADLVLAAMHAGIEYQLDPTDEQKRVAEQLTKSGVFDLVYGHHAHQVQPWTKLHGTWVVYGVSNFVGQMRLNTPAADEGIIARFTFTSTPQGTWTVSKAGYVPIYITHATDTTQARLVRVTDPAAAEFAPKSRLATARERTKDAVLALGATGIVEE